MANVICSSKSVHECSYEERQHTPRKGVPRVFSVTRRRKPEFNESDRVSDPSAHEQHCFSALPALEMISCIITSTEGALELFQMHSAR